MGRPLKGTIRLLTPAERRFAQELSLSGNKSEAARAASISQSTASKWAEDPNVMAYVRQRQLETEAEANLTRGRVIAGLLKEAERAGSAAVRVAAWTALGKAIGLFTEQHVHSGKVGLELKGQVHIYLPDNGRERTS